MYEELLEALLVANNSTLTIKSEISASGVRKGLQKVVKQHNASAAVLGLPTEDRTVSVSVNDNGTMVIALVPRGEGGTTSRFESKFQFEIVEDSDGGT